MQHGRAGRVLGLLSVIAALGVQVLAPAWAEDGKSKAPKEDEEVKIGRESATENDSQVKLVTDPAMVDRVNRIGQEIAAVANSLEVPALWGTPTVKKFEYTFKVVDDKDVNAYSLPGGFIYVHKALIDYVHSDDELAGVLAHEVAHAAHHHMMKLIAEQNKLQRSILLPTVLAALLTRTGGADMQKLLLAGQLYAVAKLNTYGVEAEKDADRTAVYYLRKTHYNPVGILTFMERLARDEIRSPSMELGIYRTHPPSPERAEALVAELRSMDIPMLRSQTDPTVKAQVTTAMVNGVAVSDVTMAKVLVARLASAGGESADVRAQRLAGDLTRLFDDTDRPLQLPDIRLSPDRTRVVARSRTLLAFTQADADAQKTAIPDLAKSSLRALETLIWKAQFDRLPTTEIVGRS